MHPPSRQQSLLLLLSLLPALVHPSSRPSLVQQLAASGPTATPLPIIPPALGVDVPHILANTLAFGAPTSEDLRAAERACAAGLSTVRFSLTPSYPASFAWTTNSSRYWAAARTAFAALTGAGCQLLPVFFFNPFMLPDAVGEPLGALARGARNETNTSSWTRSLVFIREVMGELGKSRAVVAWELANDMNLLLDLDQSIVRSETQFIDTTAGTPAARTRADNISTDDWIAISAGWASAIRAGDTYKRPISSGFTLPRAAAQALRSSYATGVEAWSPPDSKSDFTAYLRDTHAAVDWASVRLYPGESIARWNETNATSPPSLLTLKLENIVANISLHRQRALGKPPLRLFIGGFGSSNTYVKGFLQWQLDAAPRPFITDVLATLTATALNTPPSLVPAPGVAGVVSAAIASGWMNGALNETIAVWPGTHTAVVEELSAYAVVVAEITQSLNDVCASDLFEESFNYMKFEFDELGQQCQRRIASLSMQNFGPPSGYEIMTVMCKGACREYMANWFRLRVTEEGTRCSCERVVPKGAFFCPVSAQTWLCRSTGVCQNESFFEETTCSVRACGRFSRNEKAWRDERKACTSGASGAHLSASVAAAALLTAVVAASKGGDEDVSR